MNAERVFIAPACKRVTVALNSPPSRADVHNVMQMQTKRRPMSNAERQAAWREKHRPRKRHAAVLAPPAGIKPALPPQTMALELLGPEAMFENYIRKMQPAKKLYLAMLIMDDLNTLCGKRKAKRNQRYVVQALTYANELAQLPLDMPAEQESDAPALEHRTDQPLLVESPSE